MIFKTGARDLLAVVEVLGADEADDGVDEHGFEVTGYRVGTGLEGLLILYPDQRGHGGRSH